MYAASPAPSPSPTHSPILDLFTNGLRTSELWDLLWPALAGVALLAVGALAVVGYVRQWFTSVWSPHWARGVVGLLSMAASLPAFLAFRDRIESAAAARNVSVLTFAVAVAAQLGLLDEEGGRRRRRR
jgi:hypothetical protein